MGDYYTGQIMQSAFGYAPQNFAQCNGQSMPINQNQALFALLGTAYGGNGMNTFSLPDLRSRTPAGGFPSANPGTQAPGNQPYTIGQQGGVESVQLTAATMPAHSHAMLATAASATNQYATGAAVTLAKSSAPTLLYAAAGNLVPLSGSPTSAAGGGAAHSNIQPFQAINFNICLSGIFPSRN